MGIRVGIDLVEVQRVREAIDAHAQRYLDRVYSPAEQHDCSTNGIADPVRLAARFAAKEAALKVLRAGDVGISLRDIEVRRDPAGWVDLVLAGRAAALADEAGIRSLALSVTHEGVYASAVVIAETGAACR